MAVGTGNITLQDVTTEIYGDTALGRNLSTSFTDANGTFNATYEGLKDRLSNFKGYEHNALFYSNLGTGFAGGDVDFINIQSDGKILVGGGFTSLNGNTRNKLVRLNANGTEDTAFYTNLGTGFNGDVENIKIQSDGKIIIAGNFTSLNGVTRNSLVRLNSTGTVDSTFYTNLGTGFNNGIYTVEIQSDGKILVGGFFNLLNGNTRNRLVRLNSTGTEDTAFYTNISNIGSGFNSGVHTIEIQSDGKILVGGSFSTLNATNMNRLVRLNSSGTVDTTFYFNLGTAFNNSIWNIDIQSDGKIIVCGTFTSFNGNTRNRLVRLNSTGTEDTAFYTNLGTGFNSYIQSVEIQSDGKILVGGSFSTLNNVTRIILVRLNSDGTDDTAFYTNLGTFQGGSIVDIKTQSDGKILVGGVFTTLDGSTRNKLVRLNSDGTENY